MGCKPQKEVRFNCKHPPILGASDLIFGSGKDGYLKVLADTAITTVDDGDEVVLELEGLYVAAGVTLTVSNRCKGLIIKCRGDVVIDGVISMTGKGASGTGTPYRINPVLGDGCYTLQRLNAYLLTYSANEVSGTGAAGGTATTAASTAGTAGNWNFPGGGAGGRSNDNNKAGGVGGIGGSFGGGAGGGGAGGAGRDGGTAGYAGIANAGAGGNGGKAGNYGDAYHGAGGGGGGAGNPGGIKGGNAGYGTKSGGTDGTAGVGGLLMIIAAGAISVASTGIIEANGCVGGKGFSVSGISTINGGSGGAGSGGGVVITLYRAALVNNGSIVANGGAGGGGGSGNDYGGSKAGMAGGAGFTFAGQV